MKQPQVNWQNIDLNQGQPTLNSTTLCCPEVTSVKINAYPICTGKDIHGRDFGKKVTVIPGATTVKCDTCQSTVLARKCHLGLNIEFSLKDLKDSSHEASITAFPKVLDKFFATYILHKYTDNPDGFEEELLQLENLDFIYNSKKVITNMQHHELENPAELPDDTCH